MADKAPPLNVDELLAKAQQPSADAMKLHPFYHGKVEIASGMTTQKFRSVVFPPHRNYWKKS